MLLCLSTPAEAVLRPSMPTDAGGERRSNQPAETTQHATPGYGPPTRSVGSHGTLPLQPARIDPSCTGPILRLKITKGGR